MQFTAPSRNRSNAGANAIYYGTTKATVNGLDPFEARAPNERPSAPLEANDGDQGAPWYGLWNPPIDSSKP